MTVVHDFSGSKYSNFEPMRSDLKKDYSSSGDAACGKKGNDVYLLGGYKDDQIFLKTLDPICEFNI